MAWSSLDGVNDLPENPSPQVLAQSVLRFWGRVLESLDSKEFARLLGSALSTHAGVLETT